MANDNTQVVTIELQGKDGASAVLVQFEKQFKESLGPLPAYIEKIVSSGSLLEATLRALTPAATLAAGAIASIKLKELIEDGTKAAARMQVLDVALEKMGQSAKMPEGYLVALKHALHAQNITSLQATEIITRLKQGNIDLAKSQDLLTMAQNLGVLAATSTADSMNTLINVVRTGRARQLESLGLHVDFAEAYRKEAAAIGVTVEALGDEEKARIRLNTVLTAGQAIADVYDSTRGLAAQQSKAISRIWANVEEDVGQQFLPLWQQIVARSREGAEGVAAAVTSSGAHAALGLITKAIGGVLDHLNLLPALLAAGAISWAAFKAETLATTVGVELMQRSLMGAAQIMAPAGAALRDGAGVGGAALATLGAGADLVKSKLAALWGVVAANPFPWVVTALAASAVALYALSESTQQAIKKTEELAQRVQTSTKDYQAATTQVERYQRAYEDLNAGLASAGASEEKKAQVLAALIQRYPELGQAVRSAGDNMDYLRGKVLELTAAEAAEQELKRQQQQASEEAYFERVRQSIERATQSVITSGTATIELIHGLGEYGDTLRLSTMSMKEADAQALAWLNNLKALEKIKVNPGLDEASRHEINQTQNEMFLLVQQMEALGLVSDKVKDKIEAFFNRMASAAHAAANAPVVVDKALEAMKGLQDEALKIAEAASAQANNSLDHKIAVLEREIALAQQGSHEHARMILGLSLLRQQKAEEDARAEEQAAREAQAAAKQALDAKLKALDHEREASEKAHQRGAMTNQGLIALYERQAAAFGNLVATEIEGQTRIDKGRENSLTKAQHLREEETKQELDLAKTRITWQQDSSEKTMALLDIQTQEEARKYERAMQKLGWTTKQKEAFWAEYVTYVERATKKIYDSETQRELDVQLQTAKLYGRTREAKELELAKFDLSLQTSQYTDLQRQQLHQNKLVELNRSGVETMLLQWGDFYQGWDKIGENFLQNIQSESATLIKNIAEQNVTVWTGMWTAMKNIAYQALAAIGTRLLTWGIGQVAISIMPGLAGPLGMSGGGGGLGSILSLASLGKSASELFGEEGLLGGLFSTTERAGSMGMLTNSSQFADYIAAINMGDTPAAALSAVSAASSWGSLALPGLGGALGGYSLANMVYGGKGYSGIGGGLGGAAGAIAGQLLIPVPVLGAMIGGAAGGLLGGGLGSLFGGEDETPDWEKPGKPQAHLDELNKRLDDYIQRLKDGKLSQDEFYGSLAELAPLFAGTNELMGGYGQVIGGTLTSLQGLTAGTQEYTDKLNTELNPAWIISTGLAKDLASGMNELEARKKALTNAVDAYAASSGLSAEQQDQLLDIIVREKGNVAELTADYNRYNEIRNMFLDGTVRSKEELAAMGEEFRALHDKLKITSPMDNMVTAINKLVDSLTKVFNLPSEKSFNFTTNYNTNGNPSGEYHTGGMITRHSGGLLGQALAANIITAHGGRYLSHPGWEPPKPGEVDIRALLGEWVIQPAAVDYYGNDFMAAVNEMSLPREAVALAGMEGFLADLGAGQASRGRGPAAAQSPATVSQASAPIINVYLTMTTNSGDAYEQGREAARGLRDELGAMHERGELPGVIHGAAVNR